MTEPIVKIKKIYLVAAGKGGVGKSTISSLLARQLTAKGKNVGILDADIYGPSIPIIFNIENMLPETINGKFQPIIKDNIKIMSIGFLVKRESALAWRGPMISKSIHQLLFSTDWGELDYLIIDMPPGTGDIHISLVQKCKIDGVIIVSTPDKVAIGDIERAIDLYKKLNLNILGIVENMSFMEQNGVVLYPFGQGEVDSLAQKLNLTIMARLPLVPSLANDLNLYNVPKLKINFDL
jgi:ATP-binding protein involved in chromosome partitioning